MDRYKLLIVFILLVIGILYYKVNLFDIGVKCSSNLIVKIGLKLGFSPESKDFTQANLWELAVKDNDCELVELLVEKQINRFPVYLTIVEIFSKPSKYNKAIRIIIKNEDFIYSLDPDYRDDLTRAFVKNVNLDDTNFIEEVYVPLNRPFALSSEFNSDELLFVKYPILLELMIKHKCIDTVFEEEYLRYYNFDQYFCFDKEKRLNTTQIIHNAAQAHPFTKKLQSK